MIKWYICIYAKILSVSVLIMNTTTIRVDSKCKCSPREHVVEPTYTHAQQMNCLTINTHTHTCRQTDTLTHTLINTNTHSHR